MIDIHLHSKFSHDGRSTMEEMINYAISNNVKVLGFSEHLDLECPLYGYNLGMLDIPSYAKGFKNYCKKYDEKIKLLFGIELGYDEQVENDYRQIIADNKFDFIINSVHLTDGIECYYLEYFNGKDKHTAYQKYLERVLKSLYCKYDYDLIGHIGYVARQAPFDDNFLDYNDHKEIIDEILKTAIKLDKAVEVNTSIKKSGSSIIPDIDILKRYYSLGGRLISFGSDAHDDFRICENYKSTGEILKNIGFDSFCYYENRKINFYKI